MSNASSPSTSSRSPTLRSTNSRATSSTAVAPRRSDRWTGVLETVLELIDADTVAAEAATIREAPS
ncbi:MAG: hypothetical protein R2710_06075 [Acidimicrobiales bacterium]